MVCSHARVAFWLFSSSVLLSDAFAASANVTSPIVDLGYAQYQGTFDAQANVSSFLNIRFAAPPTGTLRFQAPQSPESVSGVQPATENPNKCYQAGVGTNITGGISDAQAVTRSLHQQSKRQSTTPAASEDCLFLNVFVPGAMPAESVTSGGLPVVVWIHGGGYQHGLAAEYNGADLVADSLNSVIAVVIQYRLGAFGFLSGNEVKSKGALNAGLLDQTFALQWVQDYIELFGGNKAHVTIWGESAGAGSVFQHIVANGGDTQPPLFHAAISSSTYLPPQYYYNDHIPETLYDTVVSMTGCASSADTFTCLQSVDVNTLQSANYAITHSALYGTSTFVPVVDGTLILERPTLTLASGKVNGHVLFAVDNQNEGNIFVSPSMTWTITEYISRLFPNMTNTSVQAAALIYQGYGTVYQQATLVIGESIFICPTYYLLEAFPSRSWKGLFGVPPAEHAQDIKYYFSSFVDTTYPFFNNTQFITAFSQSFLSLVKYYDVNVKFDPTNITPEWAKYNVGDTEMLFNRTEAGDPVVAPITTDAGLAKRCAFWYSVTSETAQ